MKVLFIMDPLEKLNIEVDTSLFLLRELAKRGHQTWVVDTPDLWATHKDIIGSCTRLHSNPLKGSLKERIQLSKIKSTYRPFKLNNPHRRSLSSFDIIIIRKEPPFDEAYVQLTWMLELIGKTVTVVNHPKGIRGTSEKLGILNFRKWIPKTIVTSNPNLILEFQNKVKSPLIIKPLNNKGGRGVIKLNPSKNLLTHLKKATENATRMIMAQSYLNCNWDKRITLLDGKFLAAYKKVFAPKDFRGNFSQGATYHKTKLSSREKQLVQALKPYIKRNGLNLVGLDVMKGYLIDFNVTCPGGLVESTELHPQDLLVERWADSLEAHSRS